MDGRFHKDLLWIAANSNNYDEVKRLLDKKMDIHFKEEGGLASLQDLDHKVAELLLEHKADVNTEDQDGLTLLHWASMGDGNHKLARVLIQYQANVNAQSKNGEIPLTLAIIESSRNQKLIKLLLESKSNIHHISPINNESLLHVCCSSNYRHDPPVIAKQLIEKRIDINIRDRSGQTALEKAIGSSSQAIVILLLQGGANPLLANPSTHLTPFELNRKRINEIKIKKEKSNNEFDSKLYGFQTKILFCFFESLRRKDCRLAFLMGTHLRLGSHSAITKSFQASVLYDKNLTSLIFEFSGLHKKCPYDRDKIKQEEKQDTQHCQIL